MSREAILKVWVGPAADGEPHVFLVAEDAPDVADGALIAGTRIELTAGVAWTLAGERPGRGVDRPVADTLAGSDGAVRVRPGGQLR